MIFHPRVIGYLTKTKDQEWETFFQVVGQRNPRTTESNIGYFCCPSLPPKSCRCFPDVEGTHSLDTGCREMKLGILPEGAMQAAKDGKQSLSTCGTLEPQ